MGKLKALVGLAPDVAKTVKRIPIDGSTPPPLDFLDDLAGYQTSSAKIQGETGTIPSHGDIKAEIEAKEAADLEADRLTRISDPEDSDFSFGGATQWQTRTADEYAIRYSVQLNDPVYSVRNTAGRLDSNMLDDLKSSQALHSDMEATTLKGLRQDERVAVNFDNYWGDSPYKNRMWYHLDVKTDPLNPSRLIQYDHPRQMGVHGGTNTAAEAAPGMMSPERFQSKHALIQEGYAQLADQADIPLEELHSVIARHVNDFNHNRFAKSRGQDIKETDEVFGDWNELIEELTMKLGNQYGDAAQALSTELRRMPTPTSAPMAFRGKNGLLLVDNGGFQTDQVFLQLRDIFNNVDDWTALDRAMGASGDEAKQKALQKFIESKGYDHVVYHNTVEDKGSLSFINWNEDLLRPVWDERFFATGNVAKKTNASNSIIMGLLVGTGGTGAALQPDK